MAGIHRKSYSLKIVSAAVAAALSATLAPSLHAQQQTEQQLPKVKVRAQPERGADGGYVARRSTAGTKTDTPLIETPQSITVITRD